MPVYEYDCKACGHVSESLRPMRDADAPIACESCGSKRTKRAHSVFAAATSTAAEVPVPMGGCGNCPGAGGSCPYNA